MSIRASLKRAFGLDKPTTNTPEHDIMLTQVRVNLARLDESQRPVVKQIHDSGFFLGDALRIKQEQQELEGWQ